MVRRDTSTPLQDTIHELRAAPTRAEAILWSSLRNQQLEGYKFRRQHPAGGYIIDFYCPQVKLGIEVDGGVHKKQAAQDNDREEDLMNLGIVVIRFWNSEIENHIEGVIQKILQIIHQMETST